MVFNRSSNINTIVEQANEGDTNPLIEIVNPPNNTNEYNEYDDDYPPFNYALEEALEEAYDEYISAAGFWNNPSYDLRKQETRDREKKNTKRQKRRAAKLTKKANAKEEKQDTQNKHEKKLPSKKSGRRSSPGRDFVLV